MLNKFANLITDFFNGTALKGDAIKDAVKTVQEKRSGKDFDEAFKNLVKTFHIDSRIFTHVGKMKAKGIPYDHISDLSAIKSWAFEIFSEILKKVNVEDPIGTIVSFINLRSKAFAYNKLLEALGRDTGMKSWEWEKTVINRGLSEFIKTYKREPDLQGSEEDALLFGEILEKRVSGKSKKEHDADFKDHDSIIKYLETILGVGIKSLSEPAKYLQSEGYEDPSFDTDTGTKSKELNPEQTRRFVTRKRDVMKRILEHLKNIEKDDVRNVAYMTLFHPYFKELRDDVRDIKDKDLTKAWKTMLSNLMMMEIPKKVLDYNTEYTSRQQMANVLGLSERQVNSKSKKVQELLRQDPTLINLLKEDISASKKKSLKKYGKLLERVVKGSAIDKFSEKIVGDILEGC